jgi:hypothetical protein
MKTHHWAMYRRMRDAFAPRVDINGFDINRCGIDEIKEALRTDRKEAEKVWFSRPFQSEAALRAGGFLRAETFEDGELSGKVLRQLDKLAAEAKKSADIKKFSKMSPILVDWQKNNKIELTYGQWAGIWAYYRLLRNELIEELNRARSKENEEGHHP